MTNYDSGDRAASNPPGQPTIAFRSGIHATVLRRMLDRLHTQTVPPDDADSPRRPLAALTTRDRDDPTIALLDAWATVADNLSFYQDRIANEGYLRTATERRSVLELSSAVGYELSPGVAANALLAFEVDDAPGSPASVEVPKGTRVQSIPTPSATQSQMPQTFETSETFTARAALNSFRPRLDEPQKWKKGIGIKTLVVKGTANNLKLGDHVLLDTGDEQKLARIEEVTVDRAAGCTHIDLAQAPEFAKNVSANDLSLYVFRRRAGLFGSNAPKPVYNEFKFLQLYKEWDSAAKKSDPQNEEVNEKKKAMDDYAKVKPAGGDEEWDLQQAESTPGSTMTLDAEYAQVMPGGWVAITQPDIEDPVIRQIATTQPLSRSDYGMTARVTQLALKDPIAKEKWATKLNAKTMSIWRTIVVHLQSEELPLSPTVPLASDVCPLMGKAKVPLDSDFKLDPDLRGPKFSGKFLVAGRTSDGKEIGEPVDGTIETIKDSNGDFKLTLTKDLQYKYQRDTVTFYGNRVRATDGQTVTDEVLGSGDASRPNQRFVLRHTPLTYVPTATASGSSSTLSIRINGLLWREVPSLLNQGPTSRSYTLRRDNKGRTMVIFGDGVMPTGHENVVATYRYGLGPSGNVPAGALSLLQTQPYGIRSVRNPDAASGGTAPATLQQARTLAPLANLFLGRLVSVADYTNFARTFAGIGKAQARLVWEGGKPVVRITVAAAAVGGGQVAPDSALYQSLLTALRTHGNGLHRVELAQYTKLTFGIKARVKIDTRYLSDVVEKAIQTKLIENYRFERRTFGQGEGVSSSDLITDIQTVPGVLAVDLVLLYLDVTAETAGEVGLEGFTEEKRHTFLPLGDETRIAQLLVINPENIQLEAMS